MTSRKWGFATMFLAVIMIILVPIKEIFITPWQGFDIFRTITTGITELLLIILAILIATKR